MRTAHSLVATFLVTAALAMSPVSQAHADTLWFHTQLKGANETVPNSVPATGYATAELDTVAKTVTYRVVFSGLSGPAQRVHYHGPKLPGMKAPEIIIADVDHPTSPVTGVKRVNDRQIAELRAGQWYVNVHTAKYPNGEIRGWLKPGR